MQGVTEVDSVMLRVIEGKSVIQGMAEGDLVMQGARAELYVWTKV